jgi:replicative DNA helicase
MLLDPTCIEEATDILGRNPEVFFTEAHRAIFAAILHTVDEKSSGDLALIKQFLEDRGQLADVGGLNYLEEIAENNPGPAAVRHYARTIASKARLRRLIWAAGQIAYDAVHAGQMGDEHGVRALDRAEALIGQVTLEEPETADFVTLNDQIAVDYERMMSGGTTGIRTGLEQLDTMLGGGLQLGDLVIIGARPSMGKTQLALCLADLMCTAGIQAGFFSLEMSRSSIAQRQVSMRSGVSTVRMRDGTATVADYTRMDNAIDELRAEPCSILVDDMAGQTIMQIRSKARKMVRKRGVKVIFIDYLQLLTAPESARESRQVEVAAISRGLKALAKELSIPVVALAQLNRDVEGRKDMRPRISDLRESGAIEQDADVIMLLHREAYYHLGDEEWKLEHSEKLNVAEIIVAKQRNGPTDTIELLFEPHTLRFKPKYPSDQAAAPTPRKPLAVVATGPIFPADKNSGLPI